MTGSLPGDFSLSLAPGGDLRKVLKGLLFALIGAGLTYFATIAAGGSFGPQSLVIAAALSTAANIFEKWNSDTTHAS